MKRFDIRPLVSRFRSQYSRSLQFIIDHKVAVRTVSLLLITALLIPVLFIGGSSRVSAQGNKPGSFSSVRLSVSNLLSRVRMPAVTADFGLPTVSLADIPTSRFGMVITDSAGAVVNFVSTPTLPPGFENAQPVSPLYATVSSLFSSVSSVMFGFVTSSTANKVTETAPTLIRSSPIGGVRFDFVGSPAVDYVRFRPATTDWEIKDGATGAITNVTLGTSAAQIAPGDYDGDGKTDLAVYVAGTWTIRQSSTGTTVTASHGMTGEKPVGGDYDGDGISDLAVLNTSTNVWSIKRSSTGSVTTNSFGTGGDISAQGDYDGDGKTDIAVFRPSNGTWYVLGSTNGYFGFQWGANGDVPVSADYNGDGQTDIAVFRPESGAWYIYYLNDGTYSVTTWGNYGDQPVPADYDGDGRDDLAIWRPKTGVWFTYKSCNLNNSCGGTGSGPQYVYESLGLAGDIPAPAAYLKKTGGVVQDYSFAKLRLSPKNATGGTNLYSRNFAWSSGLVGLPGRAGLDAGFGISYNSLVWLKDGANNAIIFDPDTSNITPGFNLGFPSIEPAFFDSQTGKFSYLMKTPSGGRVEFKQSAASDVYESIDSSYTQLTLKNPLNPNTAAEDVNITLRGTDGTRISFAYQAGAYRVREIKDRNGNYISVGHDTYGNLKTVTDTLGRVVTVNYDTEFYPTTITQQWRNGNGSDSNITHTYATFAYTTKQINPNFSSSLTVLGPTNNTNVKVLDKITYADTSSTRFTYNTYGQVQKISNYAADSVTELNSVETNLANVMGVQADVPRFSETRTFVKDFNNNNQVIVTNSEPIAAATGTIPGEASEAAKIIQIKMVGDPYNAATNIYVGASGWKEGLPILTDDYINVVGASFEKKRWSYTKWTQADETLAYAKNPRVIRTKIGDADNSNIKRTEISYETAPALAGYGLPKEVKLYDDTNNSLQKRTETIYNTDPAYLSKRIIGLPANIKSYGYDQSVGTQLKVSEVDYIYDGNNFTTEANQNIQPVRHETTRFGTSFITGRANLTKVIRHNLLDSTTTSSEVFYDVAGSPVASTDPLGRKITTDYTDNFSDGTTGTYAYPTTLTDPAGKSSTVKYRFDTGANVEAVSPGPGGFTVGKVSKRIYDDGYGRLIRNSIYKGGAEYFYTRYEYPNSDTEFASYSTLVAGQGEVESRSFTDGAGRVLRSRTPHRNTTSGTWRWSGTKVEYDILGRVTATSVPMEVDANFGFAGDDAGRTDWLWNQTKYDWKSRPVRQIKTDGTATTSENNSDVLISYEGCGCAGGQVTTIRGEKIIEKDWNGNNPVDLGRRTQKVYQDVLGRAWKTEIMQWNGTTPYLTTVNEYNGRDQVMKVTQTDNSVSPNVSQITNITYDGFGRTKTSQSPQQDAPTTYNYNSDDSIQSMIDARGAITGYSYDNRKLVTQVSYNVPTNSGIYDPQNTNFEYDALGNRTKMTDDMGETNYYYNQLSQMTSETRTFADTLADAPTGGFTVSYTYTLGGQLASIKDPFNDQINYTHDKLGRLTSVDGATAFGSVTNYADSPHYRAWGALQSLDYGNGVNMEMTFNNRLQADTFKLTKPTANETYMDKEYEYYADGRLRKLNDKITYGSQDGQQDSFDRLTTYDHVGRPKVGLSGAEARGETVAPADRENKVPYHQSYTFNAFNNMTQRLNEHWGRSYWYGVDFNLGYTYQNNRISNAGWQHDADGRVTQSAYPDDVVEATYDAKGQLIRLYKDYISEVNRYYDGNGSEVKRKRFSWETDQNGENGSWEEAEKKYFVRSTVLGGQVISEVGSTGRKTRTFVFAAGTVLAWQNQGFYNISENYVNFQYADASGFSQRSANKDGNVLLYFDGEGSAVENDPLGGNVGIYTPYITFYTEPLEPDSPLLQPANEWMQNSRNPNAPTYYLDGIQVPASIALPALGNGSANIDFGRTDPWALTNAGIFGVWRPNGGQAPNSSSEISENPDGNIIGGPNAEGRGYHWEYAISNAPWSPQPQQQQQQREEKTPCANLVYFLKIGVNFFDFFDKVRGEGVGIAGLNHAGLDGIVENIDAYFSQHFLGVNKVDSFAVGNELRNGQHYADSGVRQEIEGGTDIHSNTNLGQEDFKHEYQERTWSGNVLPDVDQTHHFAAYFSAGINGLATLSIGHGIADILDYGNFPDATLGLAAYTLGGSLNMRTNWNVANKIREGEDPKDRAVRILNIADSVKKAICR